MIDPAVKSAALCLAWNIHNVATNARSNADFDAALWHAVETFVQDIEAIKQRERRAELSVIDGGVAS